MADHKQFDTIVVGAGPGGIAAAVTAAESGLAVALVDDNPAPGGQIWRASASKPKDREAASWFRRLAGAKNISHFFGTRILDRLAPQTLLAEQRGKPLHLGFGSLILATGAREWFVPFPGWTSPGVFGAGGIQALVKNGFDVRGKRIIVAGSGPLLLAVADGMRQAGAAVPLIAEQTSKTQLRRFALSLIQSPLKLLSAAAFRAKLLGTTYVTDCYPIKAERVNDKLRVTLRKNDGRSPLKDETHECDYLAVGFGLVPNVELASALGCEIIEDINVGAAVRVDQALRTSRPEIFAVGESTGVGGIEKAIVEGRIAALITAERFSDADRLRIAHRKTLDFARRLQSAFALRPELFALADDETIVCRCEDVTLGEIRGKISMRDAKLQTRCGMGPCQGRVCGPTVRRILQATDMQVRPPIFSAPIGAFLASSDVSPKKSAE